MLGFRPDQAYIQTRDKANSNGARSGRGLQVSLSLAAAAVSFAGSRLI